MRLLCANRRPHDNTPTVPSEPPYDWEFDEFDPEVHRFKCADPECFKPYRTILITHVGAKPLCIEHYFSETSNDVSPT